MTITIINWFMQSSQRYTTRDGFNEGQLNNQEQKKNQFIYDRFGYIPLTLK